MEVIISDEHGVEHLRGVSRSLFTFWLRTILDQEYPDKLGVTVEDLGEDEGAYVDLKKQKTAPFLYG